MSLHEESRIAQQQMLDNMRHKNAMIEYRIQRQRGSRAPPPDVIMPTRMSPRTQTGPVDTSETSLLPILAIGAAIVIAVAMNK